MPKLILAYSMIFSYLAAVLQMPVVDVSSWREFGALGVFAATLWVLLRSQQKQGEEREQRWEERMDALIAAHKDQMDVWQDRYEESQTALKMVLERNLETRAHLIDTMEKIAKISPCPYSEHLDQHPAAARSKIFRES